MVFAQDLSAPEGPVLLPDRSWLVVEMGPGKGCITHISADGKSRRTVGKIGRPNGLAVDKDGNYVTAEDKANELVDEIRSSGGEAMAIHADVSNEEDVQRMFHRVIEAYGSVDILVNNAGLQRDAKFLDMSLEQWNFVLGVNLTGQFLCAREAAKEFVRRGVQADLSCAAGKIICMSSVHDQIPWAGHANYAASKGGIAMLMKTMAQELAQYHIRVNSIAPGAIKTPINKSAWDSNDAEQELLKLIPYGRVGDPDDVGKVAVWLASDAADYLTGITLYVDGGMMLYPGFRTGG